MKKILLNLLFIFCSFNCLNAQYSLQPTIPFSGIVQKNQLWNILALNTTSSSISCKLELILRDRTNGMEQITASSNEFVLPRGAKQLNNVLLAPIQYSSINTIFIGRGNDELLPIGNYTACYRLTSIGTKPATLAEECVQFDIEPLSPPMLAFPTDSTILNIQPAQFVWIPPTPQQLFSRLSYEVLITEILPNQKPEEAIQQNLPFYIELNTPNSLLNYNGIGVNFLKNKWYAWQVVAKDEKNYAAKSEVWVFTIKDTIIETKPIYNSYAFLNKSLAAASTVSIKEGKELLIKHYSYDKAYISKFKVSKVGDKKVVFEKQVNVAYGDNFFSLALNRNIKNEQNYLLTLTDFNGVNYYLIFRKEK